MYRYLGYVKRKRRILNYHGHILLKSVETYKAVLIYGEKEMIIKRIFKKLVYLYKATSGVYTDKAHAF